MTDYLKTHGLELVTALAAVTGAVVTVLVYRRQGASDHKVSWLVERDKNGRIFLVRTGGGTATDVSWTFEGETMSTTYPPPGDPAEPDQRIPVGASFPRSDYIAPGRVQVTWRQKRLLRTTSHTWSSQLP